MLKKHNYPVLAYGNRAGEVDGIQIDTEVQQSWEVDTFTLYVGPKNQGEILDLAKQLKPRRVIFNPGTENLAMEKALNELDIQTTRACTLVLLSTDQYED